MKNIKFIQPKQKYMTLDQIKKVYSSLWVVAYLCKIQDSTIHGGCVIATQIKPHSDYSELKTFRDKFAKQHEDKTPVYCFCLEDVEGSDRYSFTYDNGKKAVKRMPQLRIEKSEAEEAIERIPFEHLATMISSNLKK